MARIRTIKPEFFTSEDIVSLSPLARLLYVALWCEADRDGRFSYKPKTFKMRYLPADDCDIEALCAEVVQAGLAVLYGDGLAYIPTFGQHQHVNPREADSKLPDPNARARAPHASAPVKSKVDRQVGREGKGKIDDASNFDAFYSAYPRKEAKAAARKAFDKLKPDAELIATILVAVKRQAKSEAWLKSAGEFIPQPATYLNNRRWEDEAASSTSTTKLWEMP